MIRACQDIPHHTNTQRNQRIKHPWLSSTLSLCQITISKFFL
nr:MAG TPA: hypothetical protein [Bacteriophage sp.]